tara:strand:+ start:14325 stop:15236 length:912 start_codon:yes stop_codon:yes gene_type:complete
MQGEISYFDDFPRGFIAFRDHGPYRFALTDPICSPIEMSRVINRFNNTHSSILFFHITDSSASTLERLGYYINEIGEEVIIDLRSFSFDGRSKEDIRHLHNNAKRARVEVLEAYSDKWLYNQAQQITCSWLSELKKSPREFQFVTRKPHYDDFFNVRKFYGMENGKVSAFVYFDPVWHNGRLIGYCPSILRRRPESPKGTLAWILKNAMDKFREEGVKNLYLGLMPAYNIEDDKISQFRYSWHTMTMFRWFYNSAITNWFYGFKTLAFHKERYRAVKKKVYMATKSRLPALPLFHMGKLVKVL